MSDLVVDKDDAVNIINNSTEQALANAITIDPSKIPSQKTKVFFDSLQNAVSKRIARPYGKNQPVTYEITQDPAMLHQYYRLRKIMYDRTFKIPDYNWGEDSYDKISHIIVARRGNLCLGGCRLIIREADEQWDLPLEDNNFKLRELFPELHLDKARHAEVSRFAVMDDSGEANVLKGLYTELYNLITTSNIHYVFVKSPYPMARNWRLVANSFGVKTTRIMENIHPTDKTLSDDIKWYLTLSDLTSFCSEPIDNDANKTYYLEASEELN